MATHACHYFQWIITLGNDIFGHCWFDPKRAWLGRCPLNQSIEMLLSRYALLVRTIDDELNRPAGLLSYDCVLLHCSSRWLMLLIVSSALLRLERARPTVTRRITANREKAIRGRSGPPFEQRLSVTLTDSASSLGCQVEPKITYGWPACSNSNIAAHAAWYLWELVTPKPPTTKR